MSCEVESELTAYLDGELPAMLAARVRGHLDGCGNCRETEELLRRSVAQLAQLPAFEPSPAMRREVLARIDALPPPVAERLRRWFRPGVLIPSGAGLLAAGVAAVVLASHVAHTTMPAELREPSGLEVAMNYDVLNDYEVVGLSSEDDLDVVEHLQELERNR